jgi:hypothetical protein
MEFLLGSVITLVTLFVAAKQFAKSKAVNLKVNVHYSQTRAFELTRPLHLLEDMVKLVMTKPVTQTTKFDDSLHVKVVIADNEAYWISNNTFYVADVRDRMVIQESARAVDTMTMDDVQLKKISEIVEILREEGQDDRRGPGDKKL